MEEKKLSEQLNSEKFPELKSEIWEINSMYIKNSHLIKTIDIDE